MGGAEGLCAALWSLQAMGQLIHLLERALDVGAPGYSAADGIHEVLLNLMLDYEHEVVEAGAYCVVD